jgi:NDP-sugar pyrophosphorylase family protein
MKAMLLAAGYGTRLRPLTQTTPKPLLPIGDHPILVWNLLLLKRHGIRDAIINLHHLGDQIVAALGDGSRFGMRLAYSHEPRILGTGGGIKQAAPYFQNGPVLIMNGDTLSECDLTALIGAHQSTGAKATLAIREDADASVWGAVKIDKTGRIRQIKNQPPRPAAETAALRAYMFAGIHVIDAAVVDAIPQGPGSIIDVYIDLLRKEMPLFGYSMKGYWSDIGTPERYALAQREVSEGRLSLMKDAAMLFKPARQPDP